MRSEKNISVSKHKQDLRDCAVLITYLVFFLGAAVPSMVFAMKGYSFLFSFPFDKPSSVVHGFGQLFSIASALVFGGYGGIFIWIAASRFVFRFSKSEIQRCARIGRSSSFDNWLIQQIYRTPTKDA